MIHSRESDQNRLLPKCGNQSRFEDPNEKSETHFPPNRQSKINKIENKKQWMFVEISCSTARRRDIPPPSNQSTEHST